MLGLSDSEWMTRENDQGEVQTVSSYGQGCSLVCLYSTELMGPPGATAI